MLAKRRACQMQQIIDRRDHRSRKGKWEMARMATWQRILGLAGLISNLSAAIRQLNGPTSYIPITEPY